MNVGEFKTQINVVWDVLKKLDIAEDRNFFPPYDKGGSFQFANLGYLESWKICLQTRYYDFQLFDNSLIQFRMISRRPLNLSYVFYECPYKCLGYIDFLTELDLNFPEVGDMYRADYEEYITTCDTKEVVTPIRYDLAPDQYREGIHPASHVHFGHSNNIRVGTAKILKPLSFLLFILRQNYPNSWGKFLGITGADLLCRNVRSKLKNVEREYQNRLDQWEMILS